MIVYLFAYAHVLVLRRNTTKTFYQDCSGRLSGDRSVVIVLEYNHNALNFIIVLRFIALLGLKQYKKYL